MSELEDWVKLEIDWVKLEIDQRTSVACKRGKWPRHQSLRKGENQCAAERVERKRNGQDNVHSE